MLKYGLRNGGIKMTADELIGKLEMIQKMKSETNTLELKSAEKGCPQHLYDSLSSFSNQDEGGIIIFGIDEKQDYKEVGVYDPQDIQKKINEQCLQRATLSALNQEKLELYIDLLKKGKPNLSNMV